jgi:hypothetical protein
VGEAKLNRKLNLVVKVESDRGTLHVVAQPVPRSVFEDNFLIMCRAYSMVYSNGLGLVTGPQAAPLLIKLAAKELEQAEKGDMLIQEIRRLTNVLAPSSNGVGGYEVIDFMDAVRRHLIDEDAAAEIEAAICFFTLAYRAGSHRQMTAATAGLDLFWGAETSALTISDYQRSLPMLTTEEDTGTKPVVTAATFQSSIPS